MAGKEVLPVVPADCDLSVASEHQALFVNREGEAAYARLLDTLEARRLAPKDHLPWPHPDPRDMHALPGTEKEARAVEAILKPPTQIGLHERLRSRPRPRRGSTTRRQFVVPALAGSSPAAGVATWFNDTTTSRPRWRKGCAPVEATTSHASEGTLPKPCKAKSSRRAFKSRIRTAKNLWYCELMYVRQTGWVLLFVL